MLGAIFVAACYLVACVAFCYVMAVLWKHYKAMSVPPNRRRFIGSSSGDYTPVEYGMLATSSGYDPTYREHERWREQMRLWTCPTCERIVPLDGSDMQTITDDAGLVWHYHRECYPPPERSDDQAPRRIVL